MAPTLACMAYVDLNPIRAELAKSVETSDFTSIQTRIRDYRKTLAPTKPTQPKKVDLPTPTPTLMPCADDPTMTKKSDPGPCLPITFAVYLELVDWTGRVLRHDKKARSRRTSRRCFNNSVYMSKDGYRPSLLFNNRSTASPDPLMRCALGASVLTNAGSREFMPRGGYIG